MKRLKKIQLFEDLFYSFPVQLLINHFKKNQILLLLWVLLFAFITQNSGTMLGVPYLFLDPEYMNAVDYRGFLILGISLGIFIMSFHITTYILDSYRFNFLGTISRPFTKFCLNNSILPFVFTIVYCFTIVKFQFNSGFQTNTRIFMEILSFLGGLLATLSVLFLYFSNTNKDIFKELALNLDKQLKKNTISRVNVMRKIKSAKKNKYKVNYYIDLPFRFKKVEEYNAYDKSILLKIFDQNHLNAVIVEIFVIIMIIILGLFRDNSYFQIPAAASGVLFFSIFIMFTGAFSYWLRGWAISALVATLILFNFLMKHEIINSNYQAYGINYNTKQADYNLESLQQLSSPENYRKDAESTLVILENWRKKFPADKKPKMVFICTTGGGQRSAAWTTRTLQYTDSITKGNIFNQTILITGASGGIVGASYFRELYLQKKVGNNINLHDEKYFNNIGKDILNPIIFSLVVNDIFFRFQKFSDGKYEYLKDRGYAFEQQLNKNTGHVLDKPISHYKIAEEKALIPMLFMVPTIINDGRKLFISPQKISYMTTTSLSDSLASSKKVRGIEFQRMFEQQDASNLSYLSALRMSATFPYITPNVELPSTPAMEIMDAGLSDNYGIRDALKFMYTFRDWIGKNTSGVIIVSIRDSEKDKAVEKNVEPSIFQKMFSPIGSLYNNWDYMQDFNNDNLLEYAQSWFSGQLDIVDFQYIPKPKNWEKLKEKNIDAEEVDRKERAERAALSWHLTTREKESIRRTIYEANNQASVLKLKSLLEE
ncbi:MAG: patatin-like phospholipase family protein [Cytophagaceae bacterium]